MAKQKAKMNKFLTGAITATMVASAVVPVAAAADNESTSKFTDISGYDQATQDKINALVAAGIVNGTSDTTFAPTQAIKRGQVVKLLGRYLVESGIAEVPADWNSKQRFSDVPVNFVDADLVKNAAVVFDAGVFKGSNGLLNTTDEISRQNMALVLDRAAEAITEKSFIELAKGKENNVVDINDAKSEARAAIEALNALGISTVENFKPAYNVSRANFATFLFNAIEVIESVVGEDVAPEVVSVSAIGDTKIAVTFKGNAPASLKAADFSVTDKTVTDVAVSGKVATLTVNSAFTDGREYTVNYGVFTNKFTFEIGSVDEISISKTAFTANVAENIKDYVVVKDSYGQVVSQEEYNIADVESSDDAIVDGASTEGKVLNPGEANVRVKVEFTNGEVKWTEWTKVTVSGVTFGNTVAWKLSANAPADVENSSLITQGDNFIYADDATPYFLELYKNFSSGDAMPRHIDLTDGGLDKVNVKLLGNTSQLVKVQHDANGLTVEAINDEVSGTAQLEITGEIDGKAFTEKISFEVKAARQIAKLATVSKVTLLQNDKAGLAAVDSDLSDGITPATTADEEGIDVKTIPFADLVLDQYDKKGALEATAASVTSPAAGEYLIQTVDRLGNEAGYVKVSIPTNVASAVTVNNTAATTGNLVISHNAPLSQFYVTVTYFETDSATTKKYETKIPVEIKETDGVAKSYRVVANHTALNAIDLPATPYDDRFIAFTAEALDSKGNVLTRQIDDKLLTVELDAAKAHTADQKGFLDVATANNNAVSEFGFVQGSAWANPEAYFGDKGTATLKYTLVEDDTVATPVTLKSGTINVTHANNNPVPVSATMPANVSYDLSKLGDLTIQQVLFGAISKAELNLDNYNTAVSPGITTGANIFSIAPKVGFDGYVNGKAPSASLIGVDGKAVKFGAQVGGIHLSAAEEIVADHEIALDYANGAGTAVDGKQALSLGNVSFVNITNAKGVEFSTDNGLTWTPITAAVDSAAISTDAMVRLLPGVEKASFTVQVDSLELDGDTRTTAKNLLGGKKLITVTIVK